VPETPAVQNISGVLGWLDFAVLGGALFVLFLIAYITGRKEKDTNDFFLGGRRIPWIVACLSFVATEVSAVTVVGVPATAYGENWNYIQFSVGSAAARVFVAFIFIPIFYKYSCTSIYEFLKHRFGSETQYSGSAFFFVMRLLASGVRLYAACGAISILLGWTLAQSLILFTAVSIVFIAFGGIKAVVWTGAYEALFFYAAGLAVIGYLLFHIHGGLAEAWHTAASAGKVNAFNMTLSLSNTTTFWGAVLNAFFVGLVVFGTDQELVQRLLTVKTRKASQKTILATIAAALPMPLIYLSVGTLLFVFYQQNPSHAPVTPEQTKNVLSQFARDTLPMGLKGLVLAAVILASIDSPLSSLTTSFVTDIYRPLIKKAASERHYLWVSRFGIVGFGGILAAVAWKCQSVPNVLWFAFQVFGVTGGSLLGIFLLGILTKRKAGYGNITAMTFSAALCGVLLYAIQLHILPLDWTWLIALGTASTFVIGYWLGSPGENEPAGPA